MKYQRNHFYKTTRWEQKRAFILRRDGYMCQESKRFGKIKEANTVHHIFPLELFPEYAWENWNLIALSTVEHNAMHTRNSSELTDKGIELLIRTARKYDVPIPVQYQIGQNERNERARARATRAFDRRSDGTAPSTHVVE